MSALAHAARCGAVLALGIFAAATGLPPRGGLVAGVARSLDLDAGHLLWPWQWDQADPRLLLMAPMLVAGALIWRRPRWLAVAALLPVLVEAWQFLMPGLGQVAAARDVAHAWIGLATGVLLAMVVLGVHRLGARSLRSPRRSVRVAVPAAAVTLVLLVTSAAWPRMENEAVADLGGATTVQLLGEGFHPGSAPSPQARAWIEDGTVPGAGTPHEEMARVALWDLHLLTEGLDSGLLPAAGPAHQWDYIWPRDGAFVAVALARTGHPDDAALVLEHLSGLYLDPLYGFDARYQLDGDRVVVHPRGAQVDGCGWVLWAISVTSKQAKGSSTVSDLRDRCTDQLLRATGGGTHLAAPSPDYWERSTFDRLLGANAPILLGLRSSAADYRAAGALDRAEDLEVAAASFRGQVDDYFGPTFWRTGKGGGLDAATAMLMPPFDAEPLPGVREAWAGYQREAQRPGGGLAPGSHWKQDGVSWTPEVALVAYTAAADGQAEVATHWLDWLEAHRAPWGSLPEKVGAGGEPGGPAPLGWTSSLVLLTLAELDES